MFAGPDNHVGEHEIEGIPDHGNNANHCTPAKSGSAAIEESKIELVCASLDFCEDLRLLFSQSRRQSLPLLFRGLDDAQSGCGNGLEVWILSAEFIFRSLFEDLAADIFRHEASHTGNKVGALGLEGAEGGTL